MINRETSLYISVSRSPGSFGASIYNGLFQELDINAIYVPRMATDGKKVVETIRLLDIQGCSVSMPLKTEIIQYLDDIEDTAQEIGSINTILNSSGVLKGYNTDYLGVLNVLKEHTYKRVLVYGYGSVTRSLVAALKKMNVREIQITGRDANKARFAAELMNVDVYQGSRNFDLFINATPSEYCEDEEGLSLFDSAPVVLDLVVRKTLTPKLRQLKEYGIRVIPGVNMSIQQLIEQFAVYFGFRPDSSAVRILCESQFTNS